MQNLPYITPIELKSGGSIKEESSYFLVDEIPLYLPSGEGQHIYLLIKKENLNTQDLVKAISSLFQISDKDIGYAGLKDKKAITTQWISISLGANANQTDVAKKVKTEIPNIEVLEVSKHLNKLKTGHLIANRFTITISDTKESSLEEATKVIQLINKYGLPNYYGEQRFGSKGDNARSGKELLLGNKKERKHWLAKLYISAFQSKLFNQWLTLRIEDNLFNELIPGDLLQKDEGGRSFPFDHEKSHIEEFNKNEITYTGPIFGSKVTPPEHLAKEREDHIFNQSEVNMEALKKFKVQGTRRAAKVFPKDISISKQEKNLILSFTLPAGSYATIFLREFTKNV